MTDIRNLVLDFGGVLLELDERATYEAFVRLGLKEISPKLAGANMDFQRGKTKEKQFLDCVMEGLAPGTTYDQVRDAWCAMLGVVPLQRMERLKELKKKYRLFLLSNTDDIHIGRLRETWAHLGEFENLFDKIYYSQLTGFRKPEREIFDLVIRENDLVPGQTLFVDDIRENAEAASVVGMQYFWLDLSRYTFEDIPGVLRKMEENI